MNNAWTLKEDNQLRDLIGSRNPRDLAKSSVFKINAATQIAKRSKGAIQTRLYGYANYYDEKGKLPTHAQIVTATKRYYKEKGNKAKGKRKVARKPKSVNKVEVAPSVLNVTTSNNDAVISISLGNLKVTIERT